MAKLCKNCSHSMYQHVRMLGLGGVAYDSLREDMKCRHPSSGEHSLVTGSRKLSECVYMRANDALCGYEGRFWEAGE